MSTFSDPFKVQVHNVPLCADPFEILEGFSFTSKQYPDVLIDIPVGYRSDFASVPRIFWAIIPPIGRYSKATVVHDWLIDNKSNYSLTMRDINSIFIEAMDASGVHKRYMVMIKMALYIYWELYRPIKSYIQTLWSKRSKILRPLSG